MEVKIFTMRLASDAARPQRSVPAFIVLFAQGLCMDMIDDSNTTTQNVEE